MQFMIEFTIPQPITQEMIALIPEQRDKVDDLMVEGAILNYTLSRDKEKLWVVVESETEVEAFDIISDLPLTPFLKINIHPLMYHDSADLLLHFPLTSVVILHSEC
ncbi:MAG: hypothetical protein HKN32_08905 [Flavobacteriales bacterium]|nr:hypothetical protein [Flavobacteriales bacterium]